MADNVVMKNIRLITRADDIGSSKSANAAVVDAVRAGYVKNVSLMANGSFIDDAAQKLMNNKSACFGLHATLNAEWDKVKWGPILNLGKESGLIDDDGYFLSTPKMFSETKPCVDTVLSELDAQLDKLTKLGFFISYVDSHMYAEVFIDGFNEAKRNWAKSKGLLHHMDYNNSPQDIYAEENLKNLEGYLCSIPDGQYLHVTHPAYYSDEMLEVGNKDTPGSEVARTRDQEARIISNPSLVTSLASRGVAVIRYDEAAIKA